jgi:hypothetical protein
MRPEGGLVMDLTRKQALAYLTRDGDLSVLCSRYGRSTSECAPVAYRFAYLLARENGGVVNEMALDYAMGLVINDHDDVAYMVRNYGHRHYT